MKPLQDKIALVIGASRGIGAATAQRLAAEGAQVICTGRTLDDSAEHLPGTLQEVVAKIEGRGGKAWALRCDVADPASRRALMAEVDKRFDRIDILVNNAAGSVFKPIDKVTDELGGPNGLCFSPDYATLYVADTGGPREIRAYPVNGTRLGPGRSFAKLVIPGAGTATAADGIRCDVDGNVWAGARPGVQVIAPDGTPIGMIRLPETCANVCFGGVKRNRLFMTASQSLYAVYVNTTGAHIA